MMWLKDNVKSTALRRMKREARSAKGREIFYIVVFRVRSTRPQQVTQFLLIHKLYSCSYPGIRGYRTMVSDSIR